MRDHILLKLLLLIGELAHAAVVTWGPLPPLRGQVIISSLCVEDTHVMSFLIGKWNLVGQFQLRCLFSKWTTIHEECNLLGEYEWVSLTLYTKLLLHISKKVPKIDVQEVSFLVINHDVIRMTIPKAKDIACHAIASCGPYESVPCLLQLFLPLVRVVCFEMISHETLDGVICERVKHRVLELYRRQSLRIPYELQVALLAVRA